MSANKRPVRFENHPLGTMSAEIVERIVHYATNPPRGTSRSVHHHEIGREDVSPGTLKNLRVALPQLEQFIAPILFSEVRLFRWHWDMKDMDAFQQLCERPVGTHVRGLTFYPMLMAEEFPDPEKPEREKFPPTPMLPPTPNLPPGLGLPGTLAQITRFTYILSNETMLKPDKLPVDGYNWHVRRMLRDMHSLETLEVRGTIWLRAVLSAPVLQRLANIKRIFFYSLYASFDAWLEILGPCLPRLLEARFWNCVDREDEASARPRMLQALLQHGLRPQCIWLGYDTWSSRAWFEIDYNALKALLQSGSLRLREKEDEYVYMEWKTEAYERWTWYVAPGAPCCVMYGCPCDPDFTVDSTPLNPITEASRWAATAEYYGSFDHWRPWV